MPESVTYWSAYGKNCGFYVQNAYKKGMDT